MADSNLAVASTLGPVCILLVYGRMTDSEEEERMSITHAAQLPILGRFQMLACNAPARLNNST